MAVGDCRVPVGRLFVVFAILCVGASCGSTQASVDSVDMTTSTREQTVAGIDEEFRGVGEDVLRARRDVPDLADPGIEPVLTHPVDVIGPGVYEMLAGPLDASPDMAAMSTALPPQVVDSFTFDTRSLLPELIVSEDGELYLAMHLDVSEVKVPYHELQAWFY
jgi:hypothetical protein